MILILKGLRSSVGLKQRNRVDYLPREAFSSSIEYQSILAGPKVAEIGQLVTILP
jgi:hypothetical protein